jgi:hypothetical protein
MPVVRFAARRASGGQMAQPFVRLASAARQSLGGIVGGPCQARRLGLTKPAKSSRLARCMA